EARAEKKPPAEPIKPLPQRPPESETEPQETPPVQPPQADPPSSDDPVSGGTPDKPPSDRPLQEPRWTYWLGRKPDPSREEYIFDIRLSPGLVRKINCEEARFEKFRPG